MQAFITKDGILVIQVENSTEEYALKTWKKYSQLMLEDQKRKEESYFRGSKLILLTDHI